MAAPCDTLCSWQQMVAVGLDLPLCVAPESTFCSREAGSDVDGGWAQSRVIELKKLLPAILSISPYLVGIARGAGVFFVQTVDGLFSIDLQSRQVRKMHGSDVIGSVVPYESFWTPGTSLP